MKKVWTIALTLWFSGALVGQEANWPLEPTTFHRIPLNASFDEARSKMPPDATCQGDSLPSGIKLKQIGDLRSCGFRIKLEGQDYDIGVSVKFFNDKLMYIQGRVDANQYESFKSILLIKYGPLLKVEQSVVGNAAGGVLEQEKCIWLGNKVNLTLERYSDYVKESIFFLTYRPVEVLHREKIDADAQKSAKDL